MKRIVFAAAFAAMAAPLSSQPLPAWRTAATSAGTWSYQATPGGSEAVFTDATATRRLLVKCSRVTRRITLSLTSTTPASSMQVMTSEAERNLPAAFDSQAFQIIAELGVQDPLLDNMAMSRGRLAFMVPGGIALVVPAWPEIARSIEDCRN